MSTDKEIKIKLSAEDNVSPAAKKVTEYLEGMEKGADAAGQRLIDLGNEAKASAEAMVKWEQVGVSLDVAKMGLDALKGAADLAGKALDMFGQAASYVIAQTPELKLQQDNLTAGFNELVSTFGKSIAESEAFQTAVMELRAQMGLLKDSVALSENQVTAATTATVELGKEALLLGNELVEIARKAAVFATATKEMAIYLASLVNPLTAATYGFTVSTKALVAFTEAIGLSGVSEFVDSLHPLNTAMGLVDKATGAVSSKWQAATEDASSFEAGVKKLASAMSGAKGQFQEWGDYLTRYTEKLRLAGEDNLKLTHDLNESMAGENAKAFQAAVAKSEADRKAAQEKAKEAAKKARADELADYVDAMAKQQEAIIFLAKQEQETLEAGITKEKKALQAFQVWKENLAKKDGEVNKSTSEKMAEESKAAKEKMQQDWDNYSSAATTSMDAVINGMEAFGAAQETMAAAVMIATVAKAGVQAAYEVAASLEAFADFNYSSGALHAAAAVQYASVAAMTISAGPQGGGGSSRDSGMSDREAKASKTANAGSVGGSGGSDSSNQRVSTKSNEPTVINYNIYNTFAGSYTTESEAGRKMADALRNSNQNGSSRGSSSMSRSRSR